MNGSIFELELAIDFNIIKSINCLFTYNAILDEKKRHHQLRSLGLWLQNEMLPIV